MLFVRSCMDYSLDPEPHPRRPHTPGPLHRGLGVQFGPNFKFRSRQLLLSTKMFRIVQRYAICKGTHQKPRIGKWKNAMSLRWVTN